MVSRLEGVRLVIVNHRPMLILDGGLRGGIFDGVDHRIKAMRADGHIARAKLRHRLLRWVVLHNLFAFRLLRLRVVSDEDAVAQPLLF